MKRRNLVLHQIFEPPQNDKYVAVPAQVRFGIEADLKQSTIWRNDEFGAKLAATSEAAAKGAKLFGVKDDRLGLRRVNRQQLELMRSTFS